MTQVVNWGYYSLLHDKVPKEEFKKAEALAEKEVKRVVGSVRWSEINENHFYYGQLKDCICNVIDKMAEDSQSGGGKGLASVSNDGYSESYVVQTDEQLRNNLKASIRAWLIGTGLAGAL